MPRTKRRKLGMEESELWGCRAKLKCAWSHRAKRPRMRRIEKKGTEASDEVLEKIGQNCVNAGF